MRAIRNRRDAAKRCALAFALAGSVALAAAAAFPAERDRGIPQPVGRVSDFAGVVDEASRTKMEGLIGALEQKTGVQVAVVTVKSYAPYGSIEEFSIALAEQWGVGKRGEDNGVVVSLAMEERAARVEVGYGLEGIIPDGLAGEILDKSVIPSLREGRYGDGLLKGVEAVAGIVAGDRGVDLGPYDLSESGRYTRGALPALAYMIGFIALIFLFGGMRFLWPLLFLGAASGGRMYRGGFGSGGSSFGGGGFSGFGGGSFGGGGASRGF